MPDEKERRACITRKRAAYSVLLSISYSYCAETQVAIAVAEPVGPVLLVAAAGDWGLIGWTPELHLLGTTGCGPLCTGLG